MSKWLMILLLLASIGSVVAWCLNPSPKPALPINASLIKVGLSDDAMTAQEYPATTIGATGAFTLKGLKSNKLYFQGDSLDKVTITATATGFQVTTQQKTATMDADFSAKTKGEDLNPPITPAALTSLVTEDLALTTDSPETTFPMVYSITRKGKNPQYRGVLHILKSAKSS